MIPLAVDILPACNCSAIRCKIILCRSIADKTCLHDAACRIEVELLTANRLPANLHYTVCIKVIVFSVDCKEACLHCAVRCKIIIGACNVLKASNHRTICIHIEFYAAGGYKGRNRKQAALLIKVIGFLVSKRLPAGSHRTGLIKVIGSIRRLVPAKLHYAVCSKQVPKSADCLPARLHNSIRCKIIGVLANLYNSDCHRSFRHKVTFASIVFQILPASYHAAHIISIPYSICIVNPACLHVPVFIEILKTFPHDPACLDNLFGIILIQVVNIHSAVDAGNRTIAGCLPYSKCQRIITGIRILCNPLVVHGRTQSVQIPVFTCINHRIIACIFNYGTKCCYNFLLLCRRQSLVYCIFNIKGNRKRNRHVL